MDITVLNWLQAKSKNFLSENELNVIALERGVEDMNGIVTDLTVQQRDLMYADCLISLSSLPTNYSEGESHDGFDRRKSFTFTNQNSNIKVAMSIYQKYGDAKYDELNTAKKSIKVVKIIEDTSISQS